MDLSRGLGTHRKSVLLGRAPCNQLELRLYTVMFTPKSQKELATQGLGSPGGVGPPASQLGKERSLQPAAWKLETLVPANLLRAPWFLPKETRRDDASSRMSRPLEGPGWCTSRAEGKLGSSRELQCCGV
uniref:Uncharacterized protein n=1 Tax=Suricata suricatta TaxID=37032 RepID=A0A673SVN9_SURSU